MFTTATLFTPLHARGRTAAESALPSNIAAELARILKCAVKWTMHYLLKTEPSEYSFAQLQRDKVTVWDGVTNPQALKNLRGMKPGDGLIIYHTGDERRTVGTASVASVDVTDAKIPMVKIKAGRELATGMSLAEIKANRAFHDSPLLRQGRLSVVPLTEAQYGILAGD